MLLEDNSIIFVRKNNGYQWMKEVLKINGDKELQV
jgi:hypothetical protein